jgi:uncharacterized membrane protein YgaE (UPF0421/DUF939 family)
MGGADAPLHERLQSKPELLDSQRRAEVLDAATAWSRLSARSGFKRLRGALWPVTQTAVATGIAWLVASDVFGHPRPFFAPVAAITALGVMRGQRARRAIELLLGVTLGVGLADVLLHATGRGVVTLMLGVALAMVAAVLLNAGQLMLTEAAVSAAIIATVAPASHGFPPTRLLDALIGGGVALVFSQILFPVDPVRLVRRATEGVLDQLAVTLGEVADALESGDLDAAEDAMMRARRTGDAWGRFDQALDVGRETARFAPRRREARKRMTTYEDIGLPLDLTVRDVHVIARGAVRALMIGDEVPDGLVDAIRELSDAFAEVAGRMGESDRADRAEELARKAAALATRAVPAQEEISVNVLAGYTQATAADLLRTLGHEREEAHETVGRVAVGAAREGPGHS